MACWANMSYWPQLNFAVWYATTGCGTQRPKLRHAQMRSVFGANRAPLSGAKAQWKIIINYHCHIEKNSDVKNEN